MRIHWATMFAAAAGIETVRAQTQTDEQFGNILCPAGDTNGDGNAHGFRDLVVGVPGSSAAVDSAGLPLVSADDFQLLVTGAAPPQLGQFFYGPREASSSFGDGTLCIGGPFHRAGPPVTIDAVGGASAKLGLGGSTDGAILSRSSWCFQFVYQDPAGGSGWNLSDALRIVFAD